MPMSRRLLVLAFAAAFLPAPPGHADPGKSYVYLRWDAHGAVWSPTVWEYTEPGWAEYSDGSHIPGCWQGDPAPCGWDCRYWTLLEPFSDPVSKPIDDVQRVAAPVMEIIDGVNPPISVPKPPCPAVPPSVT